MTPTEVADQSHGLPNAFERAAGPFAASVSCWHESGADGEDVEVAAVEEASEVASERAASYGRDEVVAVVVGELLADGVERTEVAAVVDRDCRTSDGVDGGHEVGPGEVGREAVVASPHGMAH